MIVRVACAALHGVDAFRVDLEVDFLRQGMPSFSMVGLAEGAVREARERVFTALRNSNFCLPAARITVNLAPANRRKDGSGYDLPLAFGLLAASGLVSPDAVHDVMLVGELSLTGEVTPVPGILPIAVLARRLGLKGLIVPAANGAEAAVVEGIAVYPVHSLGEAVALLADGVLPAPAVAAPAAAGTHELFAPDFAEVKGQEHAKRAIEIAAAGGHNILLIGPPGSGKSMLAQRIPTVLPPLSFEEALETSSIYSVAGLLPPGSGLLSRRPFRAPHHTVSHVGLIGGGAWPKPGEVSLAHRGVLFLDELPEFSKQTLETLRQPLENGQVTISRAAATLSYPADSMLVAAMNPCPCGYLGHGVRACTCSPQDVQRYRSRLSGPLLDRIDLHIEVPAVEYAALRAKNAGESSAAMFSRVEAARAVQHARYEALPRSGEGPRCRSNADLSGSLLETFCGLDAASQSFLGEAVSRLALSARSYTRILRISRTIADLDGASHIAIAHLAEAINCRSLDREASIV